MRIRKVYEIYNFNFDTYDLGRRIELVFQPWRSSLILDEFIINDKLHHIYLKVYAQINSETIDDFNSFFSILKILNLKWNLNDRNMVINFSNVDEDQIEMYLDSNKYNL